MSQMPPDPPPPDFITAPSSSTGRSGAVKALIVAVVLLIAAGGAFFLLSDDGGDDPAQAVREFFAAAEARDCERMLGLVSEASWSQNGTVDREGALETCADEVVSEEFMPAGLRIESVEVTEQSDDTAEVTVRSTSTALGEQTETIPVVKEDGRWVLDFAFQLDLPED
jgi:hypothetical protein